MRCVSRRVGEGPSPSMPPGETAPSRTNSEDSRGGAAEAPEAGPAAAATEQQQESSDHASCSSSAGLEPKRLVAGADAKLDVDGEAEVASSDRAAEERGGNMQVVVVPMFVKVSDHDSHSSPAALCLEHAMHDTDAELGGGRLAEVRSSSVMLVEAEVPEEEPQVHGAQADPPSRSCCASEHSSVNSSLEDTPQMPAVSADRALALQSVSDLEVELASGDLPA